MEDANHDLIHQLSEKLDSQWRYDDYIKNAAEYGCEDCIELWQALKENEAEQIELLKQELIRHIEGDRFE
jgi:hypothetical protein